MHDSDRGGQKRRKESRHSGWLKRAPPDRLQTLSPSSSYLSLSPWRRKAGTTHTHPFSTGKQHHRGGGLGWIWVGRGCSSVSPAPSMCVCIYIAKRYTSARVIDSLVHHPDQQTGHRLNQPTHATEHRAPARDGGRAGPHDLISHDRLRQSAPRATEDARTRAPRTTSIGSARQERADVPRSELINPARPT
jgi:hypothetical protein